MLTSYTSSVTLTTSLVLAHFRGLKGQIPMLESLYDTLIHPRCNICCIEALIIFSLWVTYSHTLGITRPSVIYVENVHFKWFYQYLCSGEHFQSDLDIFQFDFMFVKPHDVPPLLCFNVQTEMRFWLEQLFFTPPTVWKQERFYSKSHFFALGTFFTPSFHPVLIEKLC